MLIGADANTEYKRRDLTESDYIYLQFLLVSALCVLYTMKRRWIKQNVTEWLITSLNDQNRKYKENSKK